MPGATVGSTGLPDPEIPGNIVPLIAGTALLASPDFDDCRLNHTFIPDIALYPDNPPDWSGPGSLWGDTYRFGVHALDLRYVINTQTARNWCAVSEEQ